MILMMKQKMEIHVKESSEEEDEESDPEEEAKVEEKRQSEVKVESTTTTTYSSLAIQPDAQEKPVRYDQGYTCRKLNFRCRAFYN